MIPKKRDQWQQSESNKSISGRSIPNALMLLMCAVISTAHTGETTYGRQPHMEVAKVQGLSPPGLAHPALPPYIYIKATYFKISKALNHKAM